MRIDIPWIGDSEIQYMVKAILKIKELSLSRFRAQKFIFSIYPGATLYAERLRPALENAGITVFDFSGVDIWRLSQNNAAIIGDGHPSPLGHRFYAELLYKELEKRGEFRRSSPGGTLAHVQP
jgi:hypothetical protein